MARSHRKRRRAYRRARASAKQIAFFTRGMVGVNPTALARKFGLGKDDSSVRRAVAKSNN
jgi:hypothetical protein